MCRGFDSLPDHAANVVILSKGSTIGGEGEVAVCHGARSVRPAPHFLPSWRSPGYRNADFNPATKQPLVWVAALSLSLHSLGTNQPIDTIPIIREYLRRTPRWQRPQKTHTSLSPARLFASRSITFASSSSYEKQGRCRCLVCRPLPVARRVGLSRCGLSMTEPPSSSTTPV